MKKVWKFAAFILACTVCIVSVSEKSAVWATESEEESTEENAEENTEEDEEEKETEE